MIWRGAGIERRGGGGGVEFCRVHEVPAAMAGKTTATCIFDTAI